MVISLWSRFLFFKFLEIREGIGLVLGSVLVEFLASVWLLNIDVVFLCVRYFGRRLGGSRAGVFGRDRARFNSDFDFVFNWLCIFVSFFFFGYKLRGGFGRF